MRKQLRLCMHEILSWTYIAAVYLALLCDVKMTNHLILLLQSLITGVVLYIFAKVCYSLSETHL